MVSSNALKIIQNIDKFSVGRNQDKAFYKTMQLITNGGGKEILSYQGECIKNLPQFFQKLIAGLKQPRVLIATKSMHKGQGIIGFAVQDGNVTTTKLAVNIDNTIGKLPIFQVKGNVSSEAGDIIGMDVFYNSNISYTADNFVSNITQKGTTSLNATYSEGENLGLSLELYYNQALAKIPQLLKDFKGETKISIIKRWLFKKSPKELNQTQKEIAELISNKGNKSDDIMRHIDLITEYASKKGKATKELLTEFFNKLLIEMGYNPKDFNITWVKDNTVTGEFNVMSGDIRLSKKILNISAQDAVVILSHEMTHATDYLKLYKKLGKERFCKLLESMSKEMGECINCDWYERASKYTDISGFNAKAFIKDIKRKNDVINNPCFSKLQRELYHRTSYQISEAELNARKTENCITGTLSANGKMRKTAYSDKFGHGPYSELMFSDNSGMTYIEEINKRLKVYGKDAGKKFDELFYTCLSDINAAEIKQYNKIRSLKYGQRKGLQMFCDNVDSRLRLVELHKKLYDTGLERSEVVEYNELIKKYYYSEESMTSSVLSRMLEQLKKDV